MGKGKKEKYRERKKGIDFHLFSAQQNKKIIILVQDNNSTLYCTNFTNFYNDKLT